MASMSLSSIFPPGLFSGSAAYPKRRIDSLDEWLMALAQPSALLELGVVIASALLAWLVVRFLAEKHGQEALLRFYRNVGARRGGVLPADATAMPRVAAPAPPAYSKRPTLGNARRGLK